MKICKEAGSWSVQLRIYGTGTAFRMFSLRERKKTEQECIEKEAVRMWKGPVCVKHP